MEKDFYKKLLKKYISHVIDCEGFSFIYDGTPLSSKNIRPYFKGGAMDEFTAKEYRSLVKLKNEITNE